jgi:PII-like signaling protein
MKAMEGDQILMRIFIGERDRWKGRPLPDTLVELFKEEGFAGATVLRGTQGFGAHSRFVHRDSILRLSQDLPVVVEVVDREEKIRGILPTLEDMPDGGLIPYEKVHVIRYTAHRE